jgi:hypothetical protein
MDRILLSRSCPALLGPANITGDADGNLIELEVLRRRWQAPRPQVVVVGAG